MATSYPPLSNAEKQVLLGIYSDPGMPSPPTWNHGVFTELVTSDDPSLEEALKSLVSIGLCYSIIADGAPICGLTKVGFALAETL
jgi:hypothetical protein